VYARVNPFGFIETPYRKVVKGKVTDQIDYLTADDEDRYVIAQANAKLDADGRFAEERVLVRQVTATCPRSCLRTWTTWTSRRARWCRSRRP
jgi:DNA-directed RNA polymerase beta subunit